MLTKKAQSTFLLTKEKAIRVHINYIHRTYSLETFAGQDFKFRDLYKPQDLQHYLELLQEALELIKQELNDNTTTSLPGQ